MTRKQALRQAAAKRRGDRSLANRITIAKLDAMMKIDMAKMAASMNLHVD